MSQLPAREVNGQYVVSITSPVTGEIVDAHYSWSRTYLQKSVPMTITVLGTVRAGRMPLTMPYRKEQPTMCLNRNRTGRS